MKPAALFMHGGIASPGSELEVPAVAGLVKRLARELPLTVYMVVKADGWREPFRFGDASVKYIGAREGGHPILAALQFVRAFGRDHRKAPYGLVHGFWGLPGGLGAVLAGAWYRVPSVVSLLGGEAASLPAIGYGNLRRNGARRATLWTCGHAGGLTALTQFQVDELRRHGLARSAGIQVIPFGAERELFPFKARGTVSPPYHFLHAGHLNRVKDQGTLLRAFRIIRERVEAHLRIVGEDTLGGAVQRLAGELGIAKDVTFTGFIPHRAMREQFAWADMLLLTSLYEGEAVVLAEAAASGVPVCGTKVGLLADLGERLGVSVMPGDHAGLAQAAMSLLCDQARNAAMREQARKWAEEHSAEWSAGRFVDLYKRTISDIR